MTLLAAGTANAYSATTLANHTISKVHLNFSSGIFIQTKETMMNPDNCGSSFWYRVEKGSSYEKESYSLLLAAYTAGKKVNIGLDGCLGDNPKIFWVNIHD